MKLAIRRIQLSSLGKFGCLLGVAVAAVPSLLCGLLGLALVNVVRRWLEGWQNVTITLFGQDIAHFDFVDLLGLSEFMTRLQAIAGVSWVGMVLLVLGLAVLGGLLLAAMVMLAGVVYNVLAAATGGLVVDAETLGEAGPDRSREG